ncbi:amino acid ABC transporter permease [Sediminicoccus sp. KRV36]|uniref:amino acid ABC transporter permease n=1 Tax=Sediminicoccus sp. KRV36 TaxID=3133721 RepID=UPI002010B9F5|nr:amino acid ABC transporter permease [Sediminicoccus rosea]UPY38660.1 amino acid ABC transporter permease [Sediminicoccus rosea]
MPFDAPELILHYLLSPRFFHAAGMTLLLSLCALLGGMVMGLVLAILAEVRARPLRAFATFYLWLFRGTPVLFQLLFAFNVLPGFGIVLPGFACAVLALSLNEGAYMAEIIRSGLRAVPPGQREAARALGLDRAQTLRLVVLPQAIRVIIPSVGNQFIGMLKLSALVSVIAVEELLLVANQTAASSFRYMEALTAAGIYYLAITSLFMAGQSLLERRMGAGLRVGAAQR